MISVRYYKMSELEQTLESMKGLILELGDIVLEWPDVFARGWNLPLEGEKLEEARTYVDLSFLERISITKNGLLRIPTEYPTSLTDDVSLAVRINRHDLGNINNKFLLQAVVFPSRLKKEKPISDDELTDFYTYMTLSRIFLSTMAYVASGGNEKYLVNVPLNQVGYLLEKMSKEGNKKKYFGFSSSIRGNIISAEFVALHQFLKNALQQTDKIEPVEEALVTDYVPSPQVRIYDDKDEGYRILSVQDSGGGVPKEIIPYIFLGRTTKEEGTGLGLTLARRIAELSGGYVGVETRGKDRKIWDYSTATGFVGDVKYEGNDKPPIPKTGSIFYIAIPLKNI